MMRRVKDIDVHALETFRRGTVIPAQVLALDECRRFSPVHQRALCRYYIDAGVGGIAVGVHSTQFAIRDSKYGMFSQVMSETARFIDQWCEKQGRNVLKVGGVCGKTKQAVYEASFEADCGYDACLLSLAAFREDDVDTMIRHCRDVADVMPLIGF